MVKMPVGGHGKVDVRTTKIANGFDYLGDHAIKLIDDNKGTDVSKAKNDNASNAE